MPGITGDDLVKELRRLFGVKNNAQLADRLGTTPATIGNWQKGITSKKLFLYLKKFESNNSINGRELIGEMRDHFDAKNNHQLSDLIGISDPTIKRYENTRNLKAASICSLMEKAMHYHSGNAIKPIVEFCPIVKHKIGQEYELFATSHNKNYSEIRKRLTDRTGGIYMFYDSLGDIVYVGKTIKQSIWKEMQLAFNRTRKTQSIYKTSLPAKKNNLDTKNTKFKKITKYEVKLHEIVPYFSAYSVEHALISNLEATMIRMLPNNLFNKKIERLKKKKGHKVGR